jgi:hypothetical protein
MIGTILFLAVVTGLGLRLARWVDCLHDRPAQGMRTGAEKPAAAPVQRLAQRLVL